MNNQEVEVATVTFLLKENKICLAPKKQDIHKKGGETLDQSTRYNGYGGKKHKEDATIRDTAVRELKEESTVEARVENLIPAGRFRFYWPNNETTTCDMDVYFFFLGTWKGNPEETEEMGEPVFFLPEEVPYSTMLPADQIFLPRLLAGEKLVADVYFGKKDEKGLPTFVVADEVLEV